MSKDDLAGARAKLAWANDQIGKLQAEIAGFLASGPYKLAERKKPAMQGKPNAHQKALFESGRFFEVVQTKIPAEIVAGTGMVIQAMRDSLDYLASTLAKRNGAEKTDDVYFVVSKSEAIFNEKETQKKLRRLSAADQKALAALKPYQGGNDLLFALHWLNNKSKHRDLLAIVSKEQDLAIGGNGHARVLLVLPPGNSFTLSEPLICFDADPGVTLQLTSANLAFREAGPVQGRLLVDVLQDFHRLATSIIGQFD